MVGFFVGAILTEIVIGLIFVEIRNSYKEEAYQQGYIDGLREGKKQ